MKRVGECFFILIFWGLIKVKRESSFIIKKFYFQS